MLEYISDPIVIAFLGLTAHILKKIARITREGKPITPFAYFARYPYQTIASLIGVVAGLAILKETGQLNTASAFAVGYMANSVSDLLAKKNGR